MLALGQKLNEKSLSGAGDASHPVCEGAQQDREQAWEYQPSLGRRDHLPDSCRSVIGKNETCSSIWDLVRSI